MSTNTRIKTIQSELERINQEIDKELCEIAERYTRWCYGNVEFSEAETRTLITDMRALSMTIGVSSKPTGQRSAT